MVLSKLWQQFLTRFQGWRGGLRGDDHQRAQSFLSPYLDGHLPQADAAWLEAHLEVCNATCPHDLENLRATVTILKQLPSARLPRNFTLTSATFVAHPRPARFSLPAYLPTATAVSALILFLLVSADLGLQFFAPSALPAATPAQISAEFAAPEDREAATPPAVGGELPATPIPEAKEVETAPTPAPSLVSFLRPLQGIALLLFLATGFATAWYTLRPRSP